MKINTSLVEKIKSAVIVVLSLSTILLLYFFWYQTPYDKYKLTYIPEEESSVQLKELILPEKITVSFGDQTYCVMPVELNSLWYSSDEKEYNFVDEFRKFCGSENIFVEEISKEKYDLAMDFRHLKAEFAYSLPFSEMCDIYDIKRASSLNVVDSMTSLMYSEGSKEGMFVCDSAAKKYYWMFADKDVTTFSKVIEVIEGRQHDLFYQLSTFVGVDNDTLIPADSLQSNRVSFPSSQEISNDRQDNMNKIAKKYFGENFDFVRKIEEDSGKFVYMYGYGEKVFIVNTDGSMEYKEEFVPENFTNKKFTESLKIATNFVTVNGGLRTAAANDSRNYLKGAKHLPEKKGYVFTFGEIVNGNNLYYNDGEIITVEVVGGQVTSCKRSVINFDINYIKELTASTEPQPLSAINMIAQNHEYIYKAMVETETFSNESINVNEILTFEEIAIHINNVSICYLKNENNLVEPAWIVTAGNANVFFELYTSQPIMFKKVV